MRNNRISTGEIMKRYEVQIGDETFVIGKDTVDNECLVCLLSPAGLTESEEYFGSYTQQRINQIYENIEGYTIPENEVYKKYAPEKP